MWAKRIFWLVVLWSGSILALGVAALALRGVMGLAGLAG